MFKKIVAASLAVCMTVVLAACQNPFTEKGENTEFPVKIGSIELSEAADKVVVLDDNTADIIIACGYADKVVGRSQECTQTELGNVPEMGSSSAPDADVIKNSGADIVFANESIEYKSYTAIEDKIPIVRIDPARTEDDLKSLYGKISSVFEGSKTGYSKGVKKAEENINKLLAVRDSLPDSNTATTSCYLFDEEGTTITGKSFGNAVFQYAGAVNIADEITSDKLVIETIKAENPNYIFCNTGLKDKIMKDNNFKLINAVAKNRVYEIPASTMTRQGNTIEEAVKAISAYIYSSDNQKGESVAEEYGIELFDGINYVAGEEDAYVLAIQTRLDDLGYMSIEPTGFYGDSTVTAVEEFQKNNNLEKHDGVADKKTLELLFSTTAIERSTPAREK